MQLGKGFEYFLSGFSLISQKGLKRFVLIPLLINLVLFGSSLSPTGGSAGAQILRAEMARILGAEMAMSPGRPRPGQVCLGSGLASDASS